MRLLGRQADRALIETYRWYLDQTHELGWLMRSFLLVLAMPVDRQIRARVTSAPKTMPQDRTENDYTAGLRISNDSKEAIAVFLEEREAKWTWS